jgi:hypothetical protein
MRGPSFVMRATRCVDVHERIAQSLAREKK